MRIYSELAPWFHLLTAPADYAGEADFVVRLVEEAAEGSARTLLELGSGGGNNASHLKSRFECTLTDVSREMLAVSEALNPECEHVHGDMRTLRLERAFDVVFAHDALSYLTTEDDLGAAIGTAALHVRRGGIVVLVPDATRETFASGTEHGGHDAPDGRSLRYLEWTHAPDPPAATTYVVDFVLALRSPSERLRVVHDRHVLGLFPEATWRRLLAEAGLEMRRYSTPDPYADEHAVFVARRLSA
jgi:hypothetical protein